VVTYPGFYAVPGAMWPGAIWPGDSIPASIAGIALFTGSQQYIYPQYEDESLQLTLVALPWNTYDLQAVGGDPGLPVLPGDGRWYALPQGAGGTFMEFFQFADMPAEDLAAAAEAAAAQRRIGHWTRVSRTGGGPLHGHRAFQR
jgi:hypothetical protein